MTGKVRSAQTLRLILGDQLNASHSWFKTRDDNTLYLIAELRQETDYVKHHVQKVCAFFAAMQAFANALQRAGHRVLHLTLDDTVNHSDLSALIHHHLELHQCRCFEYQRPDEYRLAQQLAESPTAWPVAVKMAETEHFFLPFSDIAQTAKPAKTVRMEYFYRTMRRRFNYLMSGERPLGGRWNFDSDNRKAFKASDLAEIPEPLVFHNDISEILDRLDRHQVTTFGEAKAELPWPVTRQQARKLLQFFCEQCLPRFGRFQDAMTTESPHAWSLYHSRLSFAINAKMLSPREVVETAIGYFQGEDSAIDLAQIEGFVRQILGWREYIRLMYWLNMPDYSHTNALRAKRPLPRWFWDGNTNMNCLHQAIRQSLEHAYAHHIQRLMITGNFALLAGLDPAAVDGWYLGIYIDAIEWVELPNTRGMALFADGGWIASKPYAASGNYISKMSNYCKGCRYSVKVKSGSEACPFTALYWHFIDRHQTLFAQNPRMAFPLKSWQKKSMQEQSDILERANHLLKKLDEV